MTLAQLNSLLAVGEFAITPLGGVEGAAVYAKEEFGVHLALDWYGWADHEEFEDESGYSVADLVGKLWSWDGEKVEIWKGDTNSVAIVGRVEI